MITRLLEDVFNPAIEEAIRDSGILDVYLYQTSMMLVPGPGGVQPTVAIFLAIPNPAAIGTRLSGMTMLPPSAGETMITTAVLALINNLGEERRKGLTT